MAKTEKTEPVVTAGDLKKSTVVQALKDQAEAQAKQEAPKAVEKGATPADMQRLRGREFEVNEYVYTAHEGTQPKDLLSPEHWAHVATQFRPRDRVEAWANDGTWMAEFVVLEAGRNWSRLYQLTEHRLTTADVAMTQASQLDPYEIAHRGPHEKWSVIRKVDRAVVHSGEETRDGADAWLKNRLKAG